MYEYIAILDNFVSDEEVTWLVLPSNVLSILS